MTNCYGYFILKSMLKHLFPREERFFDQFIGIADCAVHGAAELKALIENTSDAESKAKRIKELEHKADEITHRTLELLHQTFITPLDRNDIHQLSTHLDDIVDYIDAAAERIHLYKIKKVPQELHLLAQVCVQSTQYIKSAVVELENLKNAPKILKFSVEINRLENEGDQLLRKGMAKLFEEETDTKELIKIKEIYEILEGVTDRCEDVVNILEGIVLEYS